MSMVLHRDVAELQKLYAELRSEIEKLRQELAAMKPAAPAKPHTPNLVQGNRR